MTPEQRTVFERKMKDFKTQPLFVPAKRKAREDTAYLIISYGGTGRDALIKIRDTLKTYLSDADYKKYVRILAIDSDLTAQYKDNDEKGDKIFPDNEFFHLAAPGARSALDTDKDLIGRWINPVLPNLIKNDNKYLDGKGASATRQVGRLTLYPSETNNRVRMKVNALLGELTDGNNKNLNVIIVTGISGGTGSGTVIDLTYLIRDCLKAKFANYKQRVKVSGMVLLPPTGTDSETDMVKRGNRNGYAALKEINHFMTLGLRNDKYSRTYQGNNTIISNDNIFDTCYLIDGRRGDINLGAAARDAANNVVANCILDMLTAIGKKTFDSILSDVSPNAMNIINLSDEHNAPRDAEYLYCSIGHCTTEIPLNAMKTFLAYKCYEVMYNSFKKCGDVTDDDVEKFFYDVCNTKADKNEQRKIILKALTEIFQDRKRGPFYVINLLSGAADYAPKWRDKHLFKTDSIKNKARQMQELFVELNNRYFTVFTATMETMKKVLQEGYDTVVDSDYYTQNSRNYYSFTPIHLGQLEGGNAVADYLDCLVYRKDGSGKIVGVNKVVTDFTNELLSEIINNRDEWSQLITNDGRDGTFEAPKRIREFFDSQMDRMLDASVEDFLIKWYSKDRNAHYDPKDPGSTQQYLNQAARTIYDNMFGGAGMAHPMANLNDKGLDVSKNRYILVPSRAPHLLNAIAACAAANNVTVVDSSASDRITAYAQYACLPAFKFRWVTEAEKDYENDILSAVPGMHMSEAPTGDLWKEFSSLRPQSCLHMFVPPEDENPREKLIAERAEKLFNDAFFCGLTMTTQQAGAGIVTYAVNILPEDMRPDRDLFRNYYSESDGGRKEAMRAQIEKQSAKAAQELFEKEIDWKTVELEKIAYELASVGKVTFEQKDLRTTHETYVYGTAYDSEYASAEAWFKALAARCLRKTPNTMYELEGSIRVMEKLIELVRAEQEKEKAIVDFAKYLAANLIVPGEYDTWVYKNDGIETVLETISKYDQIKTDAKYFYLFEAMRKNYTGVKAALEKDFIAAYAHQNQRQLRAENTQRLVEGFAALNAKVEEDYAKIGKNSFEIAAKNAGNPVDEIRAFYKRFKEWTGTNQTAVNIINNI